MCGKVEWSSAHAQGSLTLPPFYCPINSSSSHFIELSGSPATRRRLICASSLLLTFQAHSKQRYCLRKPSSPREASKLVYSGFSFNVSISTFMVVSAYWVLVHHKWSWFPSGNKEPLETGLFHTELTTKQSKLVSFLIFQKISVPGSRRVWHLLNLTFPLHINLKALESSGG